MPDPFLTFLIAAGAYRIIKFVNQEIRNNNSSNLKAVDSSEIAQPQRVISFVGTTSVGKSSTINALIGRKVSEVNVLHGTTRISQHYEYQNGYILQDTPGLMDEENYLEMVIDAIQESSLVVYMAQGQLYQQELENLCYIQHQQADWDKQSKSPNSRCLALYVNKVDIQQQTLSSKMVIEERQALLSQVSGIIDTEWIAFGSAAPVLAGKPQEPNISDLIAMLTRHILRYHS